MWTVEAMSPSVRPWSIASTNSWSASEAPSPTIVAPRTLPEGVATTLANPAVRPSIRARSTCDISTRKARTSGYRCRATASVTPTEATSGSTNVAHGIAR